MSSLPSVGARRRAGSTETRRWGTSLAPIASPAWRGEIGRSPEIDGSVRAIGRYTNRSVGAATPVRCALRPVRASECPFERGDAASCNDDTADDDNSNPALLRRQLPGAIPHSAGRQSSSDWTETMLSSQATASSSTATARAAGARRRSSSYAAPTEAHPPRALDRHRPEDARPPRQRRHGRAHRHAPQTSGLLRRAACGARANRRSLLRLRLDDRGRLCWISILALMGAMDGAVCFEARAKRRALPGPRRRGYAAICRTTLPKRSGALSRAAAASISVSG